MVNIRISFFRATPTTKIFAISFVSLLLGLSMLNTYFTSEVINLIGLTITSYFIYYNTLRKNDVFAFIMVLYFCSLFPYLGSKGGGFNLVALLTILFYVLTNNRFPGEISLKDKWFKFTTIIFIISSILGWFTNYVGEAIDIIYSISTFLGVISLLLVASRIIVTQQRIRVFLEVNMVLIVYSTIASLNKYINLITFNSPLLPIYGIDDNYIEGGGTIGSSPLYGEYSMIVGILFSVILILTPRIQRINKNYLIFFLFLSIINVFMSISRSVFLLLIMGIAMVFLFQLKINNVRPQKMIAQILFITLLGIGTFIIAKSSGIDYVFSRVEEYNEESQTEGGITIDRIIDGSAFARKTAFSEATKKYNSKENWWIGYGWGLTKNNRYAFYVDTSILRGSAHSQIFAILFLFGWTGFIAYYGLVMGLILKSYNTLSNNTYNISNRIFAYFTAIVFLLFVFNEIKADSVSNPSYFAFTMILTGFAYSNINSAKFKIN